MTAAVRPGLIGVLAGTSTMGDDISALAHLLDVQFWLMGRDVAHPDGNLLQRLGFERQTTADPSVPARYRRCEPDPEVIIWRCGLLLRVPQHDCLLLRGCEPVLVGSEVAAMHNPVDVGAARAHSTRAPAQAIKTSATWFASYEASIADIAGVRHRDAPPRIRPALAPPEPCSLERAWRQLACTLDD
ncbi:hypothetical protein ACFVJS_12560 [Nocardioides sp. NPDC057772]|uniref:hypothetical protein n=1 Tax=Nocardioides sp. NPDC057772 TaxID=3346245 RepID=UPI00366F0F92